MPPNQPAADIIGGQPVIDELEIVEGLADTGAGLSNVAAMRGYLQRVETRISGLPPSDLVRLNRSEIVWMLEGGTRRERVLRVINNVRGQTSELLASIGSLDQSQLSQLLGGYRDAVQAILKRVNEEPIVPLRHGETRAANDDYYQLFRQTLAGRFDPHSVEMQALLNRVHQFHPTTQKLEQIRAILTGAANGPRPEVDKHINPRTGSSRGVSELKGEIANRQVEIDKKQNEVQKHTDQINFLTEQSRPRAKSTTPPPDNKKDIKDEMDARKSAQDGIITLKHEIGEINEAITYLNEGGPTTTRYNSPVELYMAVVTHLEGQRGGSMTTQQAMEQFEEDIEALESPERTYTDPIAPTMNEIFEVAANAMFKPDPVIKRIGKKEIDKLLEVALDPDGIADWAESLDGNEKSIDRKLAHLKCFVAKARRKGVQGLLDKGSSAKRVEALEDNLKTVLKERIDERLKDDPDKKVKSFNEYRKLINRSKRSVDRTYPIGAMERARARKLGRFANWLKEKTFSFAGWTKDKIVAHQDEIAAGFETTGTILHKGAKVAGFAWLTGITGGLNLPYNRFIAKKGWLGNKNKSPETVDKKEEVIDKKDKKAIRLNEEKKPPAPPSTPLKTESTPPKKIEPAANDSGKPKEAAAA